MVQEVFMSPLNLLVAFPSHVNYSNVKHYTPSAQFMLIWITFLGDTFMNVQDVSLRFWITYLLLVGGGGTTIT